MNLDKAVANPYAPPQSVSEASSSACYRDGKLLVVPTGQALPERCIKCNAPAILDKPRTFSWHSPGWYVLLFVAILVYIIAAVIVRKKVKLAVGLCAAHRQRRRTFLLTALGLLVFGCLSIFVAIQFEFELLGWLAVPVLLVALIVALYASSTLSPARIEDAEARFRGCGEVFLNSLPER